MKTAVRIIAPQHVRTIGQSSGSLFLQLHEGSPFTTFESCGTNNSPTEALSVNQLFGNMKRRVIIGMGVVGLVVATPFLITWSEEWRLYSRDRLAAEIGYSLPQNAEIIGTSAHIWSLADGANYSWSITSASSLLPWVQSIGKLEYDQTYRVYKMLMDGREETSYVTLASDERAATVETFRP